MGTSWKLRIGDTEVHGPPSSIPEGEDWMEALYEEYREIELELSNPNRTDRDGNRLENIEYQEWRYRAKRALHIKRQAYSKVKKWVKREKMQAPLVALELDSNDPDSILFYCLKMFKKLAGEKRVEFDPEEQLLIDAIRAYFQYQGIYYG